MLASECEINKKIARLIEPILTKAVSDGLLAKSKKENKNLKGWL